MTNKKRWIPSEYQQEFYELVFPSVRRERDRNYHHYDVITPSLVEITPDYWNGYEEDDEPVVGYQEELYNDGNLFETEAEARAALSAIREHLTGHHLTAPIYCICQEENEPSLTIGTETDPDMVSIYADDGNAFATLDEADGARKKILEVFDSLNVAKLSNQE